MTHLIVAVVAVLSGIGIGLLIAWGWRRYRLRRQRLALVARITSVSVDHVRDVMVRDGNEAPAHTNNILSGSATDEAIPEPIEDEQTTLEDPAQRALRSEAAEAICPLGQGVP